MQTRSLPNQRVDCPAMTLFLKIVRNRVIEEALARNNLEKVHLRNFIPKRIYRLQFVVFDPPRP